jgi:hypothetical protein
MQKCPVCTWHKLTTIRTYAHDWISCDLCGTIRRVGKAHYPAERLGALVNVLPAKMRHNLLPDREVQATSGEAYYRYYEDSAKAGVEGTKWAPEFGRLTEFLAGHGVSMKDRDVLDISGGPGFVVKALAGIARRAVVTEFSPAAVTGMVRALNIEAVKYDYASDHLDDLFPALAFDVVLVRNSINFCTDLRQLALELQAITRPQSTVYVSFTPPTLGTCLRWQTDPYTYEMLYQPESMVRAFAEAGFAQIALADEGQFRYDDNLQWMRRVLMLPYRFLASRQSTINHELIQKSIVLLFRRS